MLTLSDPSLLKSTCYVNGTWIGEGVDPIDNPATGAVLAKVPRFGEAETTTAVEAAQTALALGAEKR